MPPRKQPTSVKRTNSGSLSQATLGFGAQKATSIASRQANKKQKPSSAPKAAEAEPTTAEDEVVTADVEITPPAVLRALIVNDKAYNKLHADTKKAMGGMPPINNAEDANRITDCLRTFDLTAKYGPCTGMTRLQRWERAKKWGLSPPQEVRDILNTQEGVKEERYRESVLSSYA